MIETKRVAKNDFFGDLTRVRHVDMSANEILRVRVGSRLYGTATAESDTDVLSVWIPSLENSVSLGENRPQEETLVDEQGKTEVKHYALRDFVSHSLKCNLNILEAYYADPDNVISATRLGGALKESVRLFLSKDNVYAVTRGYAAAQRKKLTFKRERLSGFMEALEKVRKVQFDGAAELPDRLTIGSANERGYWRIFEKGTDTGLAFRQIVEALTEYGWRKELIEKYGFDVKFSANLIRILAEGFDLLYHGEIRFPLRVVEDLRDIREGRWTMQEVLDASEQWERRLDEAYAKSKLPEHGDYAGVNKLLINLTTDFWGTPCS